MKQDSLILRFNEDEQLSPHAMTDSWLKELIIDGRTHKATFLDFRTTRHQHGT